MHRRRRELRDVRTADGFRAYARGRLIESRLTPNAISLSGLILNLTAAVLITQRLFFLAGVAFIVGSVMDTLDGRYSRMSGKGTLFGAFLDSTLDRIEEGIVLDRRRLVLRRQRRRGGRRGLRDRRAGLADGLLHAGTRRGARRRVQGRDRDQARSGGHPCRSGWCSRRAPGYSTLSCWRRPSTLWRRSRRVTVCQRVWHVRQGLEARSSGHPARQGRVTRQRLMRRSSKLGPRREEDFHHEHRRPSIHT